MENNTIKAIDFMTPLHQRGLITDKEFSVLQKSDPPALDEFKCIVYTPDREFALAYEYDYCDNFVMGLFTADRIKMYGTYDKIKSCIEFNVFADGDLLEDFCINI